MTNLTNAQLLLLKADILANTNVIPANRPFAGTPINTLPNTPDANHEIALWYSLTAAPDFFVWRDLPMETVLNTITFANQTPIDSVPVPAIPLTPTEAEKSELQVWIARSLACQGKQFNLQNLTIGRTTATMKRSSYRSALQDCLTNIPAGASGALIAANWVGVRDSAKFTARYIEKLLATGTGTFASPADMGYEGTTNKDDVETARNLP